MGSQAERTCGKSAAVGPSGGGGLWAKLQLPRAAAAGVPDVRPRKPEFQHGEIKTQTSD